MSKLSEYSKFDHLDSDDDDDSSDGNVAKNNKQGNNDINTSNIHSSSNVSNKSDSIPNSKLQSATATTNSQLTKLGAITKKSQDGNRYIFEMNGRKVYEWEQSLDEVTLYIDAPPNVTGQQIICNIETNRLRLGLRNHDRFFIDERTFSKIKAKESSWYLDDGVIHIVLVKVFRGETWEGVLMGAENESGEEEATTTRTVDSFTKQQMQQDLMKERYQEENPGFDFRDATFNGEVPDPRTFMGGVRYD